MLVDKFQKYIDKYRAIHTGQDHFVYISDGQRLSVSKAVVYGDGRQFVKKVFPYVDYVIKAKSRAISILDYGCGKARHVYDIRYVNNWRFPNFRNQTIFSFFPGQIQSYYCYDPAVPQFSLKPSQGSEFDLVAVPDVMEHIPEENLEPVIKEVFSYVRDDGLVVWTISGNSAIAHFSHPDGSVENAHITVKSFNWWRDLLISHSDSRAFVLIYSSNEIFKATNRVSDTRLYFHSSAKFKVQRPLNCRGA